MKNPVQFWFGLFGLVVFGLLILSYTCAKFYAPAMSAGWVVVFSLLGVFMGGELVLIGLGKDEPRKQTRSTYKRKVFPDHE